MGRTLLPYSHVLESERDRWKPFRRALRKEDQEAFDRLFDRAKMHTSTGVYMANPWPMETYEHDRAAHAPQSSDTPSPVPKHGKSPLNSAGSAQTKPSAASWG